MDDTYHGTRGYSGSSTSEDAAYADLVNGVTNVTQRLVLILAKQAGPRGITVAEIRENNTSLHHGRISSALTKHHISGRLAALYERRGNCGVYVVPEFQNERPARPYHRQGRKALDPEIVVGVMLEHPQTVHLGGLYGWHCGCGWTSPEQNHKRHLADKIVEALNG